MVLLLVRRSAFCAIGRYFRESGRKAGTLLDRGATLPNSEDNQRLLQEPKELPPIGGSSRRCVHSASQGWVPAASAESGAYLPAGIMRVNDFFGSILVAFFKVFFAILCSPYPSFDLPYRAVALPVARKGPNLLRTAVCDNPRIFFAPKIETRRHLYERPVHR
jgi:hypothetical protein